MTYPTMEEALAGYPALKDALAGMPRELVDSDGLTTNLWHRQHEYYQEHVVPLLPTCDLCGGSADPRVGRHELCRARKERGLPTPRLSIERPCACCQCRGELERRRR